MGGPRQGHSRGWIELERGTGGGEGRVEGKGNGFEESVKMVRE